MANSVWIGYLGPTQVTSDGSGIVFPGTVTATRFLSGDGTAAAPAFSFINNTNMGFYRNASNQMTWGSGGGGRFIFTDAAQLITQSAGSYNWTSGAISAAVDTRIGRAAASAISLGPTTGVTLRWATDGTLELRNFANSAYATLRTGTVRADTAFDINGTTGVTAGPFTTITSITVVGGIVTALTGS